MEQNKIIKLFTGETVKSEDNILNNERERIENMLKTFFKNISEKALKEIAYITKLYNNPSFSYVYFLYNKDTKLTKIGCTSNLFKRMKQIVSIFKNNIGIVPNLELLGVIIIHKDDMYKLEATLHNDYEQYHTFGEWYNVDIKDIMYTNFIDSLENSILINDTYVCVGEYNEYEYFEDIPKDYSISIGDLENIMNTKLIKTNFIDDIFYKNNKLLDINLTMLKNNIGFNIKEYYIVDCSVTECTTSIGNPNKNDIQTISKIKRKHFNKEEIEATINYLHSITK